VLLKVLRAYMSDAVGVLRDSAPEEAARGVRRRRDQLLKRAVASRLLPAAMAAAELPLATAMLVASDADALVGFFLPSTHSNRSKLTYYTCTLAALATSTETHVEGLFATA
jgi:hypothetical protein